MRGCRSPNWGRIIFSIQLSCNSKRLEANSIASFFYLCSHCFGLIVEVGSSSLELGGFWLEDWNEELWATRKYWKENGRGEDQESNPIKLFMSSWAHPWPAIINLMLIGMPKTLKMVLMDILLLRSQTKYRWCSYETNQIALQEFEKWTNFGT